MIRTATTFLALAPALLAAPALAQDEAAQAQTVLPSADRVTVQGARPVDEDTLAEITRDFVHEIADTASVDSGIARWQEDICVGVENLAADAAQYVADRVSSVALEMELEPGEPGCEPNIAVIFAPDGDTLADIMIQNQPSAFRPFGGAGGTNRGLNALEQFRTSGAAIRWWHVTLPVDQRGWAAIETNENDGPPWVPGGNSHIRVLHRDVLLRAIVIVDGPKIAALSASGISWRQIADYIAMVALAQINPESDAAGYDSILNLFTQDVSTVPNGLSDWDRAYLKALYEFDQYRIPDSQPGVLANELVRQVTESGAVPVVEE